MKEMRMLFPAIAALAFGLVAMPGQAAPVSGLMAGGFAAAASENSTTATVHWRRRSWSHRGHWHSRRHARRWYPDHYSGGYYPRRHYYRYRPGFAIYGPGFGLHIGPRYKPRHWW